MTTKPKLTPQQKEWVKAGHPVAYINYISKSGWTTFSCRVCETGWSARSGLIHDPCPHCGTHVGYITKSSSRDIRPDGPGATVRRRPVGAKPGDTVIMLNESTLFEVTCVVEEDGYVTLPAGPDWTDYRLPGSQGGWP